MFKISKDQKLKEATLSDKKLDEAFVILVKSVQKKLFPNEPKNQDGKLGPMTILAAKLFLNKSQTNAIIRYTSPILKEHGDVKSTGILIDFEFKKALDEFVQLASKNNLKILVTDAFRKSFGKIKMGVVSEAKMSNHLVGHAIDFNIIFKTRRGERFFNSEKMRRANWKKFKVPLEVRSFLNDLSKIGRWGDKFNDPVHFDDHFNKDVKRWKDKLTVIRSQIN